VRKEKKETKQKGCSLQWFVKKAQVLQHGAVRFFINQRYLIGPVKESGKYSSVFTIDYLFLF
jgi:hypothetical protein